MFEKVDMSKELHFDCKKNNYDKMPLHIKGEVVQQVPNYQYLFVIIGDRLQPSDHVKIKAKSNKRMYFLRKLTKLHVDKTLITLSLLINCSERIVFLCSSLRPGIVV